MGDRCYVTVEVHPEDAQKLVELVDFGHPENEEVIESGEAAGAMRIAWSEINGGGYTEFHDAAEKGLRFVAHNDEGAEYGPGLLVAFGGNTEEIDSDREGCVLVMVEESGEVNAEQLAQARRFLELRRQLRASYPRPTLAEDPSL